MSANLKYWIWLSSLVKIPPVKRMEIYQYFKSPEHIWHTLEVELRQLPFIEKQYADQLLDKDARKEVDNHFERIMKADVNVVTFEDGNYPQNLKNIYDPPLVLYCKGRLNSNELNIAVVGSRNASRYGVEMAEKLAYCLSQSGITITSGMARGIDSKAHMGALKAGGRTIAVLGCGVDIVYPSENKELMKKIISSGAAVSEYLPGTPPIAYNFPARNRIISGMSSGTVIVEASEKSGSLITAGYALEQGREVFALPGNIDSRNSAGTNRLIHDGAKMVLEIADILEEINIPETTENDFNKRKKINTKGLDEDEKMILKKLKKASMHIDIIANECNMEVNAIGAILIMLELKGFVEQLPGKIYSIKYDFT